MKAKRPDFLVLLKNERFFVEVKPNSVRPKMPQLMINVDEIQKLNQLQLMSGVETLIAFPIDTHGTAWKSLRPAWISAHGLKRKNNDNDVFIINVRKPEKLKFPFTT